MRRDWLGGLSVGLIAEIVQVPALLVHSAVDWRRRLSEEGAAVALAVQGDLQASVVASLAQLHHWEFALACDQLGKRSSWAKLDVLWALCICGDRSLSSILEVSSEEGWCH